MKLLLDTHIWIWFLIGHPRLPQSLQIVIAEETNELWLSPISIWETLILAEKRKIILQQPPEIWIKQGLELLKIQEAFLTNDIALLSRQLNLVHQDPADRFIVATAVHYGLILVTVDDNLIQASCVQTLSQ